MKIYLAGFKTIEKQWNKPTKDIYLLSSFYEHKTGTFGDYVYQKNHILDSGAFSFFGGKKVDWIEYTKKYCNFINKTKQELFFELDIDTLENLKYVEYLRKLIEDKTGKQPIPVWRPSRKIDYWHFMCENYPYVAISASGAYDSAWTRTNKGMAIIAKMLSIAKENKTKVHGLGYTATKKLQVLKFDSVDSTTWNVGGKFGDVCVFDENGFPTQRYKKQNSKVKNTTKINLFNFEQWIKFQKYADKYL